MSLNVLIDKLRNVGLGSAVSGALLVGGKFIYENFGLIHKSLGYARNANKSVVPLVYGIVGSIMGLPGGEESLTVGLAEGLDGLVDAFVIKKPFAYAKDSLTIEVFNLDPDSNIDVYIDGTKITFTTSPKTDAAGHAVITLPSEMSAGKHEVLIKSSVKAWAGAVAV